jgi:hypothetical protein
LKKIKNFERSIGFVITKVDKEVGPNDEYSFKEAI